MPGKFPALLALIFLLSPVPLAGQTPPSDKAPRIEGIVSHYEKLGQFNGAILVADHGNIICAEGVGDANMESHTPNTRFGIASLTKQFTALLVLQQAAEGKILLPGKVSDYLPWYRKDTGSRMTIEQLLHHTSCLPPDLDLREQIFSPLLHDWGYGWFITKIPAGQPGAGSTVAEMRGDMPDNFFTWTLRYPERDAVIITLRNVYGSTEGLEQNIQAILFDAVLHLPSRNPKDIAAQICLLPIRWMASHVALAVIFFLFIAITIWFLSRHLQPA